MEQSNKNTISSLPPQVSVASPDGKSIIEPTSEKTSCRIFCAPLIIYIIITLIYAYAIYTLPAYDSDGNSSTSEKMKRVGLFLAISSLGGLLFAFLCYKCWNTAAWILIILVFLGFLSMIYMLFVASMTLNILGGLFSGGTKTIEIDIESPSVPSPSLSSAPAPAPSSGSYN